MKLTLKMKLLPSKEQAKLLLETLKQCNKACNYISGIAWENNIFNQFKIHHIAYRLVKDTFNLSAQVVIRCISKVADAYKLDRKKKRIFNLIGGITYDTRILSYKESTVSIWTVTGRERMPFVCHNPKYLPYIKGEADLVHKKDKFYLFQTVDIPEVNVENIEEFIGVDFGITDIATLSDGTFFGSEQLNKVRDKRFKVRKSVQSKGTKGSRKLLKRLKGRESRFAANVNHAIAKKIVSMAVGQHKGIAIEDLTGINDRAKVRKSQRRQHHSWSFYQLRSFLEYKSRLAGVRLVAVPPAYTSKTCNACKHIGDRNGKLFKCPNCGNIADADINAAQNIAQLGSTVNRTEKESFSCALHL